ncbi:epithelial sodium channel subunit alpha-like [Diadema antillarum]|uniref:epithelial sodium channel subunit alpha-like n=1 Tax=Diadema antillarum TaxID=105358 RepID=UPI003A86F236
MTAPSKVCQTKYLEAESTGIVGPVLPGLAVSSRKSLNALLLEFSNVTTAHGVPRIITGKSTLSKLLWSTLTLAALGAFLWQGSLLFIDFSHHPYTTQIDLITKTELDFPAVTVCNMNRMRRSALVGTRFESLIEVDGGVTGGDDDYSWWFEWESEWWRKYDSSSEALGRQQAGSASLQESQDGDPSLPPDMEVAEATTDSASDATSQDIPPETGTDLYVTSISEIVESDEPSDAGAARSEVPGSSEASESPPSSPETAKRRRRRSDHHVIPDPVTGHLNMKGGTRKKRQVSSNFREEFEWWESDWEDDEFEYESNDWDVDSENDWEGFYERSRADDFSDLLDVVNPTRQELEDYGHQAKDFILQCTFDRRDCNYTDFTQFQNRYYGNCFTFNQVRGNSISVKTGKTGAQYGLHLTLFTEQPEYVGLFAQESGVRVSIHPPTVFPFPEDDGVVASTGQATNVGLHQSYIQRLGKPHGNCTDGSKTNFTSTEYSYSSRACVKSCIQQHLFQRCGCVTDIMMNDTICSPLNRTQQICRQAIEAFFLDGKLECICPIACEETNYITAVSSSLWPSERYDEHLTERLKSYNEKADRILQSVELTRKNLARVRVYFEELNYEQMIQNPKYTVESLLGGIGGLLGLYIGLSMLSVCEVGILIIDIVRFLARKAYYRNKVVSLKSGF